MSGARSSPRGSYFAQLGRVALFADVRRLADRIGALDGVTGVHVGVGQPEHHQRQNRRDGIEKSGGRTMSSTVSSWSKASADASSRRSSATGGPVFDALPRGVADESDCRCTTWHISWRPGRLTRARESTAPRACWRRRRPIAQVRAPGVWTALFRPNGINAICVPMHVQPSALEAFFHGHPLLCQSAGSDRYDPHKPSILQLVDEPPDGPARLAPSTSWPNRALTDARRRHP